MYNFRFFYFYTVTQDNIDYLENLLKYSKDLYNKQNQMTEQNSPPAVPQNTRKDKNQIKVNYKISKNF